MVNAQSAGIISILTHDGDPGAWPRSGASDVAVGRTGRERFLATIEPWHGNNVVVYRQSNGVWKRVPVSPGERPVVLFPELKARQMRRPVGKDDVQRAARAGPRFVGLPVERVP